MGKFFFLRYTPKCSQPIRLQVFLISHISRTNQWNSLLLCKLIQICKIKKTVRLFNNQQFLKHNMNQPFLSDITICQCHMTTFRTCSPLVLLYMVLFLCFIFPPQQFRIQILKLAFAISLSLICIFYCSIHIWLYTHTIDLSGDIKKNPGPRPSSSQNILICHWNLSSTAAHSYVKFPF